jgi:RNA methyltransferase, TrmH family
LRNPRVQRARRLIKRAQRREENAFLLEGDRALADALEAGAELEELFVSEELAGDALVSQATRQGVTVHIVGAQIIKAISASVTPQGIVAVVRSPLKTLADVHLRAGLALVLAGVSDPGNVGTLLRTAAAAGADAVVLTDGSSDPLNPKTARASAAALFATPVIADVSMSDAAARLKGLGYSFVGTDAAAIESIYDGTLTAPTAIVLGNEAWGLPEGDLAHLDRTVSIPMPGSIESLNVATAGAVILFESLRQRLAKGDPKVSSGPKGGPS